MPRLISQFSLCLLFCAVTTTPVWAEEPAESTEPAPAESTAPATERSPLMERSEVEAQALEQRLDIKEQQQLHAAEQSFLALWRAANTADPQGAVILVPGDDENADWPQSIGPLRRKLPDAGWHTLSLTLPSPVNDIPQPHAAPAEAVADNEDAEDTPETPAETVSETEGTGSTLDQQREARAEQILARLDAAITFASEQHAKTIVLLGHGSGAYWAARYLAERKPQTVKNLLLVSARLPSSYTPSLDELIPNLKLATGDFYYKDQAGDRQSALQRAQASKRQKHPAYLQVAMKALPGNPEIEQEQLYRRIRGWLSMKVQAHAE